MLFLLFSLSHRSFSCSYRAWLCSHPSLKAEVNASLWLWLALTVQGGRNKMAKLPLTFPRPECSCLLAGGLAKPQFDGSSLSRNAAHASPEHKVPLPECFNNLFFPGWISPAIFCTEAVPASSHRSASPSWMCPQGSCARGRRNPLIHPSTQHICSLALCWHLCTELSITHQL